jgi:hypothetical protein
MRPSEMVSTWAEWKQAIQEKYANVTSRFLTALAEEEMKLRREEILRQIKAQAER